MASSEAHSKVSQFSVQACRHKIIRLMERASRVFPQGIVVTCIPGYAVDETARDDNNSRGNARLTHRSIIPTTWTGSQELTMPVWRFGGRGGQQSPNSTPEPPRLVNPTDLWAQFTQKPLKHLKYV